MHRKYTADDPHAMTYQQMVTMCGFIEKQFAHAHEPLPRSVGSALQLARGLLAPTGMEKLSLLKNGLGGLLFVSGGVVIVFGVMSSMGVGASIWATIAGIFVAHTPIGGPLAIGAGIGVLVLGICACLSTMAERIVTDIAYDKTIIVALDSWLLSEAELAKKDLSARQKIKAIGAKKSSAVKSQSRSIRPRKQSRKRTLLKVSRSSAFKIPSYRLLKKIGEGAYGEVWIGASETGSRHAIKIIRRARFDSAQNYGREFKGIKLFEPVSRKHPGLVPLLSVGYGQKRAFYYYVMERADATNEAASDASYEPMTLRHRIDSAGRLQPGETLSVARLLTDALCYLHGKNLIHRDIKPSNVVFIDGKPRLADVGLVAQYEGTQSYVGTIGYFPPEGIGKPEADVYAIGKVMYEMLTGQDRQAFPAPPNPLPVPDRLFQDLNSIVLRACASEKSKRFASAEELLSALDACVTTSKSQDNHATSDSDTAGKE